MRTMNLTPTSEVMEALQGFIREKLINLDLVKKNAKSTVTDTQCLVAEMCVLEVKMDAMMQMMNDKDVDFNKFNDYSLNAAKFCTDQAKMVREQILAGLPFSSLATVPSGSRTTSIS